MKIIINTEVLRDALKKIGTITVNKQLPVLSYIKLMAVNGKVTLTTTDLEKVIEIEVASRGGDDFQTLLPRQTVSTFLNGNNGNLTIEINDKGVTLSRDNIGALSYKPYDIKYFPPIPTPGTDTIWANIDAEWFCRMLGFVLPACASEVSRPVLTGVAFTDNAMASADGFRMVEVKNTKLALGLGVNKPIVPARTLDIVRRIFAKEDTITIGFDLNHNRAYFKSANTVLTSQTIQGNYPNWEILIPKQFAHKISLSAPLMVQRILMINPKSLHAGILRLYFQRAETNKEMVCTMAGSGEEDDYAEHFNFTMPVKIETAEDAKIAVSYKYLCDALKPFSLCNLDLTTMSSPLKFTGDIEGLTIVVMPMFVQW